MCRSLGDPGFRTCRLASATPERLRELTRWNLDHLARVLEWNRAHGIRMYRIGSGLVPFASHPVNALRWWEEEAERFARLGEAIVAAGTRVSMHPGQHTVVGALDARLVAASVADLVAHARLLDALGAGGDAKVVVHLGGLYGQGPAAAIERFARAAARLPPEVTRRLVVENDERLFTAEDVLEASRATGLPAVFDWLHHRCHPGRAADPEGTAAVLRRCLATWREADGVPKVHLSSQAAGRRTGAHADHVETEDLLALLRAVPREQPFDCMLEAKEKERALLDLRRRMEAAGVKESDAPPTARAAAPGPPWPCVGPLSGRGSVAPAGR